MSNGKKKEYHFKCNCGTAICFTSKQPEGGLEPIICNDCWSVHLLEIPAREGKYLYRMQSDTLQMRKDILAVFSSYQEKMTVRQMFYRLVGKDYEKRNVCTVKFNAKC